jgi:cation diffusion facilitator CzcD-associated flavoprotein CzcO
VVERGRDLDRRGAAQGHRETVRFTCGFLFMCAGYYSYREGYTPEFEGMDRFQGKIVHPQKWPEDLDYKGKRVVVIGSGATAVTLVPAMANDVAHIYHAAALTDLHRVAPRQGHHRQRFAAGPPEDWAYAITRWKNVSLQQFLYRRTRTQPEKVKAKLLDMVRQELGPDYDIATHFTPTYNPWDQRLCLVPTAICLRPSVPAKHRSSPITSTASLRQASS